ncbi:MAG: hypothetical protein PGN21_09080 [Sphingomonas paucimobilis]
MPPQSAGDVGPGTIGSVTMRLAMAGVAMLAAVPAMAQDVEPGGPDIVVTAGKPLKLDAKVLRAGQRRFAEDRAALSPEGSLRFELWRGGRRIPAGTLPIVLSDDKGQTLPVTIDGDGRMVFATLPEGRWFLTAPAQSQGMHLRPIVLSRGTTTEDRRLGDIRAQCHVTISMGKAQATLLEWPLIGLFEAVGACESKRFQMFHQVEHPIARATAMAPGGERELLLSKSGTSYAPPMSDRTLGNDVRVKIAYR